MLRQRVQQFAFSLYLSICIFLSVLFSFAFVCCNDESYKCSATNKSSFVEKLCLGRSLALLSSPSPSSSLSSSSSLCTQLYVCFAAVYLLELKLLGVRAQKRTTHEIGPDKLAYVVSFFFFVFILRIHTLLVKLIY